MVGSALIFLFLGEAICLVECDSSRKDAKTPRLVGCDSSRKGTEVQAQRHRGCKREVWRMFFSRRGASAEIQKGLSAKDCYAIFIPLVYLIYWQAK